MIQKKEEDTTQPSPIKPESQKPVRAKRTKIINPAEEHAEIIEPENDAIVTKIIEETITISVEGQDDTTTVVPDKKNSKKNWFYHKIMFSFIICIPSFVKQHIAFRKAHGSVRLQFA